MGWISNDTKQYLGEIWKDLWYYSSLSFSIALSIMIGTGLGYLTDMSYGTNPVWTLIGLTLGTLAGFRNIYIAMKKVQKDV